ncbi:MAG: slipin family protein [Coriobacteriia bacterium]|nr:slipin family protein [Coriobacteriia bacterium]
MRGTRGKGERVEVAATPSFVFEEDTTGPAGTASRNGAIAFSVVVFFVAFLAVLGTFYQSVSTFSIAAALLGGVIAVSSIHIALEWEKAVVLRLGKYDHIAGPGLYFTIPLIEYVAIRIDQRIMTTPFGAQETLTSDLVPLDVDAVLFWMVWDAKKACTEVGDFSKAVSWVAQTAMRDAVGRVTLAEIAMSRSQLDRELQKTVGAVTVPWGITIVSVQIRDIVVPKELQDAMSRGAQAERERDARITLAEVEKDIAEMFAAAALVYDASETALRLRTMNLIYESVRQKGGLVVVPSAFSEGFNDVASDLLSKLPSK